MEIIITTADLKEEYDVLDIIFVVDSDSVGIFRGSDQTGVFESVTQRLRTKCSKLGGNAVVGCRFQFREILDKGKPMIEISAYGTAVKLK